METKADTEPKANSPAGVSPAVSEAPAPPAVSVDGIRERVQEIPVAPGNYRQLMVAEKALFWLSDPAGEGKTHLCGAPVAAENVEVKTVVADVRTVELSGNRKKFLVRKGDSLHIFDAACPAADLDKKDVVLDGWKLSVVPREEWKQMFTEAWRLERDYFYDPGMHGVDWKGVLEKYRPLAERVTCRAELSDLLARVS